VELRASLIANATDAANGLPLFFVQVPPPWNVYVPMPVPATPDIDGVRDPVAPSAVHA
jgi:hypothetical protein